MGHTSEQVFSEIVDRAKSGTARTWPSDDRAIIWAYEEIQRLREEVKILSGECAE